MTGAPDPAAGRAAAAGDDGADRDGSTAAGGLTGQVAVVSGAVGGLGAAWCGALRRAGATVVGFDIRPGCEAIADASDPDQVQALVDRVVDEYGGIDISVANAGRFSLTSPLDPWAKALTDFDEQVGTNLKGVFLLGRAVAPAMVARGGGHIVNVSTDHVLRPPGVPTGGGPAMDVYDASKWAIRGLTESWAAALRPHGVRVNELCMGATDTDMLRGFLGDRATPDVVATWMRADDLAEVLIALLLEGPEGRTGEQIGLWVGHPLRLPPRSARP